MLRVFLFALCFSDAAALVPGPWSDRTASPVQRARLLVQNLSLEEKLNFLHGTGMVESNRTNGEYTGNVYPVTRVGIPPITMNDGPQGWRPSAKPGEAGTSTAWPSGLTIAASWDVQAVYEWGSAMGKEFYDKGANVQLGPAVCIVRLPRNGRNFEYMSGEDPVLGMTLVQPAVRGIQSQKVVANAKHFVLNNQETDRYTDSAETDEKTRFELYYPPFEGAIAADVGSFMCSYNKINGVWSCENPVTLGELKTTLGFKGYVMSDWMATHSASIMEGLDMEMPYNASLIPQVIRPALQAGSITIDKINDSVTRILRSMFAVGVMDEPLSTWDSTKRVHNVTTAASVASARRLSAVSTVLLKNSAGTLPLEKGKKIVLIGFAHTSAIVHSGGSGGVVPSYVVTPFAGITAVEGVGQVSYTDGTNLTLAAELAESADYAIVFVGTLSAEGADRASLSLDDGCNRHIAPGVLRKDGQCEGNAHNQNAMVAAVAAANKNTVVVASVPGAVLMPWSPDVAAILVNFMPGQQAGAAIADVLFGRVNPSARLPITFPNCENETNISPQQWPGVPMAPAGAKLGDYSFYTEKLLVGYRYYDAHKINFVTGFPFGHGLSYTSFQYSDLAITGTSVSFTVRNAGGVAGSEVAQLYLSFPPAANEPILQLKGFKKTSKLDPGEATTVTVALTARDFSTWDPNLHKWSLVQGSFTVRVGSSSRDIRLISDFIQESDDPVNLR